MAFDAEKALEGHRENLKITMQDMLERSTEMLLNEKTIDFFGNVTRMNPKDWSYPQLAWIEDLWEQYVSIDCAMRQK